MRVVISQQAARCYPSVRCHAATHQQGPGLPHTLSLHGYWYVRYNLADLHVHTLCSDGLITPAQAVQQAADAGLQALGITDHDSVEGISEATAWGQDLEVDIVPGTELSAHVREREVHLLGYCLNWQDHCLRDTLHGIHQRRLERGKSILKRLNNLGIHISIDDVLQQSKGSPLGRPHIAAALMKRGLVASKNEAFTRFIGDRGPAYAPKPYMPPESVITLIHRAGGVAVLAHPGISFPEHSLVRLVDSGLDGIEVYHPAHQPSQLELYHQMATRYHLLMTGGSDCHGERNGIRIGEYGIGYEAVTALRNRAAVYRNDGQQAVKLEKS